MIQKNKKMLDETHTTNYFNTFIEVAEDSSATHGVIPKSNGDKQTIARMQFEMISKEPYTYTSDDVLFKVYAERNDISEPEQKAARATFFSKGQACFRASPLPKKHGFGVHSNKDGKIAIYEISTEAYEKLIKDSHIQKVKAMRTSKK